MAVGLLGDFWALRWQQRPRPPNAPLLRALWSLLNYISGFLKGLLGGAETDRALAVFTRIVFPSVHVPTVLLDVRFRPTYCTTLVYLPVGWYHTPFLVTLFWALDSYNHKVGFP